MAGSSEAAWRSWAQRSKKFASCSSCDAIRDPPGELCGCGRIDASWRNAFSYPPPRRVAYSAGVTDAVAATPAAPAPQKQAQRTGGAALLVAAGILLSRIACL